MAKSKINSKNMAVLAFVLFAAVAVLFCLPQVQIKTNSAVVAKSTGFNLAFPSSGSDKYFSFFFGFIASVAGAAFALLYLLGIFKNKLGALLTVAAGVVAAIFFFVMLGKVGTGFLILHKATAWFWIALIANILGAAAGAGMLLDK